MAAKQDTKQEKKKINPIMEYLAPLKGTFVINDPNLMLA